MKRMEIGKALLAASVLAHPLGDAAQARTTNSPRGGDKEHVRVLDPVAVISQLVQSQMKGWDVDCKLAKPDHALSQDEQRILSRAEALLYGNIIPFMAEYESAVDLDAAYRKSGPDVRARVQTQIEAVMPALYEFQRLRASHPSVICPLRSKRRY